MRKPASILAVLILTGATAASSIPTFGAGNTERYLHVRVQDSKEGESVARDEPLLELETDKVTVEVPAPAAGSIESISVKAGATVQVGTVLGSIAEGKAGKASSVPAAKSEAPKPAPAAPVSRRQATY